jgi:hypothetical protein
MTEPQQTSVACHWQLQQSAACQKKLRKLAAHHHTTHSISVIGPAPHFHLKLWYFYTGAAEQHLFTHHLQDVTNITAGSCPTALAAGSCPTALAENDPQHV